MIRQLEQAEEIGKIGKEKFNEGLIEKFLKAQR
jgi:hypothetical protein